MIEGTVQYGDTIRYKTPWYTKLRWAWQASRRRMTNRIEDAMLRFVLRREMRDSGIVAFAKRELLAVGYKLDGDEEDVNKWVVSNVLELAALFARQGHSGSSAPYVAGFAHKVMMFEPVKPITGEDSEWQELSYSSDPKWQNTRCSHVFKEADGRAYDMDGRIFREPSGACYTSLESRVYIEFPYTPKREYVDVKKYQHEGTGRVVRTHINPGARWFEVPWETEECDGIAEVGL